MSSHATPAMTGARYRSHSRRWVSVCLRDHGLAGRVPAGGQVVGDQLRTGAFGVRRVGCQPGGDLLQLGGQALLGHRLTLPPAPVLIPDRPPPLPRLPRRVHRHPTPHLHHHTVVTAGGLAGVPADPSGAPRSARDQLPPRPEREASTCYSCGFFVGILVRETAVLAITFALFLRFLQVRGLADCPEKWWSGAGSNRRPSAFQAATTTRGRPQLKPQDWIRSQTPGSPPVRRSQTSAAATLRAVEQCRSSMAGSPGHQLADPDHQQWPPRNAQICAAGAERGIDAATAPNGGSARPVLIIALTRGNQARGGRHHSRAATYFFRPSIP